MKYNFDQIPNHEGTFTEKYDLREMIFSKKDVIPMWVADMDFSIAPFIKEAVEKRAAMGIYGYSFRGENFALSVKNWLQRRNNWTIKDKWVEFSPGVVCAIAMAIRAFTHVGDKIVIQTPVYPPFARTILANNREVSENVLKKGINDFEIDFEDLEIKLRDAECMILCNPHNPTGRVFSRAELERIAQLCVKHKVLVISDEIHSDLVQKPCQHIHIASLGDEISNQTITLVAASKTFNLAGLSTSAVIIKNEQIREKYSVEFNKIHADQGNIFGAIALQAAYENGDDWVDQLNEYIAINKAYVVDFIHHNLPELEVFNSEGTYLLWINFSNWGMNHEDLYQHLIHKAGLGLDSGLRFGEHGTCYMRMNIATSLEIVKKAMEALLKSKP